MTTMPATTLGSGGGEQQQQQQQTTTRTTTRNRQDGPRTETRTRAGTRTKTKPSSPGASGLTSDPARRGFGHTPRQSEVGRFDATTRVHARTGFEPEPRVGGRPKVTSIRLVRRNSSLRERRKGRQGVGGYQAQGS